MSEWKWNGQTWDDAPEWSTCRGYDKNGMWYWYEGRPEHRAMFAKPNGRHMFGGCCGAVVPNWRDTLEMRPEPAKKPQPLHIAKLICAAVAAGLIELEDVEGMPDDIEEAILFFSEMSRLAAQASDHWNRVERATMAIIESMEAAR